MIKYICRKIEVDKLKQNNIKNMQPLVLAFVGDSVHTLFVRKHVCGLGEYKVNQLTRMTKEFVNAGKQCEVFKKIEAFLSEDELDVARRARNAQKGQIAKNYSPAEYNYATAFEAVVGYLYLTNQEERLNQILELSISE